MNHVLPFQVSRMRHSFVDKATIFACKHLFNPAKISIKTESLGPFKYSISRSIRIDVISKLHHFMRLSNVGKNSIHLSTHHCELWIINCIKKYAYFN